MAFTRINCPQIIFVFVSLAIVCFACSPSMQNPNAENHPGGNFMGELIQNKTGGYEIRSITGYEYRMADGYVYMFPPEGDRQSGPGLIISAEQFQEPINQEKAVEGMVKSEPAYLFSNPIRIQVGGFDGLSMDFTTIYHAVDGIILDNPGADEGEEIHGRAVLVVVDQTRLIKCIFHTPQKDWEKSKILFEDVIKSIKFFDLVK
jgi:hypothetical protein